MYSSSPTKVSCLEQMEEGSGLGCEQCSCRTWEEEIYWKYFDSIHFYLILPQDFHDHLVLPAKFSENMMAKLPDKVSLRGPSDTVWDVELLKTNTTNSIVFVGDGWEEFVKTYELKENNLLMFHYKGNKGFEVLILDQETLCEKEATYFVKKCRHTKSDDKNQTKKTAKEASSMKALEDKDGGEVGDEGEDNNSDDKNQKKRTAKKTSSMKAMEDKDEDENEDDNSGLIVLKKSRKDDEQLVYPRTPRKCVSNADNRGRGTPRKPPRESKIQSEKKSKGKESHISGREQLNPEIGGSTQETAPKSSSRSAEKKYISNRRPVSEIEKKNTLERALQEMTQNSFFAVMRPTSVYKRFYMSIPTEWMNKHLPHRHVEVVLRVGDKTWLTTFYYDRKGTGGLSPGWKKFALDNSLEEFDVCLFKLASQKDDPTVVLDVYIFRVIPEIVPPTLE